MINSVVLLAYCLEGSVAVAGPAMLVVLMQAKFEPLSGGSNK